MKCPKCKVRYEEERRRCLDGAKPELDALRAERDRLQRLLDEMGIRDEPCTCGPDNEPRRCYRHPWVLEYAKAIIELEVPADGTLRRPRYSHRK